MGKLKPGALKDVLMFMNSEFDWFEKNVKPQLEGLSENDAIFKISTFASNRTAMNRMVGFYKEEANFKKAAALGHQAMGSDSLSAAEAKQYQLNVNEFTARWTDLMIELGTSVLPTATKSLEALTDILKFIEKFFGWKKSIENDMNIPPIGGNSLSDSVSWWGSKFSVGAPPQQKQQTIVVQSVLDSKIIAQSTVEVMNGQLQKTSLTGPSFPDFRASPFQIGAH